MDDILCLTHWSAELPVVRNAIVRDVTSTLSTTAATTSKARRTDELFYSLRWGVLLSVLPLPVSEWVRASGAIQTRWQAARAALCGDSTSTSATGGPARAVPRKTRFDESSSSDTEDNGANPLRPAVGSRYAHEFHVNAQRREVRKDLDRLFWDVPVLTENPQAKAEIEQLVLCYCLQHERDYRQGLHELAAFFYCTCMTDHERAASMAEGLDVPVPVGSPTHVALESVSSLLLSREAAAALAYCLFERLMSANGLQLESWFYTSTNTDTHANDSTGIVAASRRVQTDLLRTIDPVLEQKLTVEYDIQSATYLIRWLRLLFLREFSLPQSLVVWTVIFVDYSARRDGPCEYVLENSLVVFIAVAMLEHIAGVLCVDADTALRALMKYPTQTDVATILRSAAALACLPELSHALAPPPPQAAAPTSQLVSSPASMTVVERQGHELSAVIQSLESYWFPTQPVAPEQKEAQDTAYIEAIARLKKVRDVLLYDVDE